LPRSPFFFLTGLPALGEQGLGAGEWAGADHREGPGGIPDRREDMLMAFTLDLPGARAGIIYLPPAAVY